MNHLAIVLLAFQLTAQDVPAERQLSPVDVVNERNRALNAHELEAFMATYADDVSVYVYPAKKLGDGKKHIRKIFALLIETKSVKTVVKKTMANDGFVVVESVNTVGKKTEEGIAIYEVRGDKIKSVRFLRDKIRAKRTDADAGS